MGPGALDEVLSSLPQMKDPRVLIGPGTSDDAGVILIDAERALVQTVDFFSPIVDDCYLFGQIAAANSLSDIYAMGAEPLSALNIACFPTCLTAEEMGEILRGGADKLSEAGAVLLGGHTVENPEPKFGMAVTGIIHPDGLWQNRGAQPGDVLLLTKPLGTGVLSTALKADMLSAAQEEATVETMRTLNKMAAAILRQQATVHACTDVTGFGFLGHLVEMIQADAIEVTVNAAALPLLSGALELAQMGLVPGGAYRNREFFADKVTFATEVPLAYQDLMFDPQTSGGLLAAIPAQEAVAVQVALAEAGVAARVVAKVRSLADSGPITVIFDPQP